MAAPVHGRPCAQLPPRRLYQEKPHFEEREQRPQRRQHQVVEQQRDATEQKEPVNPDGKAVGDQRAGQAPWQLLGRLVRHAQTGPPQPPPGQRETALLQVWHLEPVREQVIAVETHEGIEIHRERADPREACDHEGGRTGGAIGQEGPGQRCESCQHQLHQHARTGYRQSRAARSELPGVRGIRVEDGPRENEGHAHRRHPQTGMARREGMPELMRHLDQRECERVAGNAGGRQRVDHARGETVPATEHEEDAEQSADRVDFKERIRDQAARERQQSR